MRSKLIGALTTLAGGTTAAVLVVVSVLSGGDAGLCEIDCVPDGDECIATCEPLVEQCDALMRRGGDNAGPIVEAGSLDKLTEVERNDNGGCDAESPDETACRLLVALREHDVILDWHTSMVLCDGGVGMCGCSVAVRLTAAQAHAWREALTGETADGEKVEEIVDAPAVLGARGAEGVRPRKAAHAWAGASLPEERAHTWDLGVSGEKK